MEKQPSSFNIVNALSIIIVVGYAGLMPLWIFSPPLGIPDGVLAIINQMMGAWQMAFATVVAYHLGSSKGQKEAQDAQRGTMQTLSSTVASTAATAATVAATAAGVPPANGALEIAAWDAAVTGGTPAAWDEYLRKFPTGAHAAEARARLAGASNP